MWRFVAVLVAAALIVSPAHGRLMHRAPLPEGPLSATSEYDGVRLGATMQAARLAERASLPPSFDVRDTWPGCLRAVLDQGDCGSCWSFASTTVLSARFCIESAGAVNVSLSPENLLECEKLNLKCTMGSLPAWAWNYMVATGVATLDCDPYVSGGGQTPPCEHECAAPGVAYELFQARNYTHYGDVLDPRAHVETIMAAMVSGGPVTADYNVYADFDSYAGGVYTHQSGGYEGLHSVTLVGYGTTAAGEDYWLVQNSWGADWGPYGGYFMIARGVNECGIETLVYGGTAALP